MSELSAEIAALRAEVAHTRHIALAAEVRLSAAEQNAQEAQAEARMARQESRTARRQMRVTWAVSSLACLLTFTFGLSPQSRAQFGVTLTSLNTAVLALQAKTASMSVLTDPNTNEPTVRFSGVNVQVVSGSGATSGTINGTGNVIVGYNELRNDGSDSRTGSHNLIVGIQNNYSSYGGTVIGEVNTISGVYASVTAGANNAASGSASSVSGGYYNTAGNSYASVSGGYGNAANSKAASVSGGYGNAANNNYSSVSGGDANTASGQFASVSGGQAGNASGGAASVSGGNGRTASATLGWDAGSQATSGVSGNFSSP